MSSEEELLLTTYDGKVIQTCVMNSLNQTNETSLTLHFIPGPGPGSIFS